MRLKEPDPAKLLIGGIFSNREKFDEAVRFLEHRFGPVEKLSDEFPFGFTDYYEKEMGPGLKRVFVSFVDLLGMERLVKVKRHTLQIEKRLAVAPEVRSVNLDPGYISPSNLVLATTKGYSHRIYLGECIYGDVQLIFKKGSVETLPWTYPDYRSDQYQEFFLDVRSRCLRALRDLRARASV